VRSAFFTDDYLGDIGVPVFGEPSHLLNGVFEYLGHKDIRIKNSDRARDAYSQ